MYQHRKRCDFSYRYRSVVYLAGEIKEILLALITGLVVGLLFAKLKLPIPAPPTCAGIMGIVGIFLGYWIFTKIS